LREAFILRQVSEESEMKKGSKTFDLCAIANQLIDYCNIPESRRSTVAADIQKSAERLLAKLKRSNQAMQLMPSRTTFTFHAN
jgi:hypothetical protein